MFFLVSTSSSSVNIFQSKQTFERKVKLLDHRKRIYLSSSIVTLTMKIIKSGLEGCLTMDEHLEG